MQINNYTNKIGFVRWQTCTLWQVLVRLSTGAPCQFVQCGKALIKTKNVGRK